MRRIRINTLFAIFLSLITVALFLILFYVSVKNIREAESFTEKNALHNISLLVNKVFVEDIKSEASVINKEFKDVVNQGKRLALLINMMNSSKTWEPFVERFKFDRKTGIYKYFDKNSLYRVHDDDYGDLDYGFFALYYDKNDSPPEEEVYRKFNNFSELLPLLREVFSLNKMIFGVSAYYFKGLYLSYIAAPEFNFKAFNNKRNLLRAKANYTNFLEGKDRPVFKLARSVNADNFTAIGIFFPLKNENNDTIGSFLLIVSYDILIDNLTKSLLPEVYRDYQTLRLVIDEEGHIAYLPREKYSLFSIPLDKAKLFIKTPEENPFIETKLTDSDNSEVRNMNNKLFSAKSGNFEIKLKGDTYIAIYETLSINNWKVILLVKKDDLYKPFIKTESKFRTIYKHIYENYILTFLLVLIIGFTISFVVFKKVFISPIEHLRRDAAKLGEGNFDARVCEFGLKEIFDLSKTFNKLGGQLKTYTDNLKKEIKVRQTIETELKIAADLQKSVLPKVTSDFENKLFKIYAKLLPAKEMSGDFYDFFYIREGKTLVVVLADVSGKGLRAAFYMSMAKAIIKETCLASSEMKPGLIMEKVNNILYKNDDSSMFLTAYIIFYDALTGKLIYSNAGHHDFICANNKLQTVCTGQNMNPALGIIEECSYTTSEYQLELEEVLFLFTDGIIEAPDENGAEYGIERLEEFIKSNFNDSLEETGNLIISDVLSYQKGNKFDDTTLLMLKRLS